MDQDAFDKLAAHSLAQLTILTHLCRHLARVSPKTAACVRKALDESSSKVEDIAIILGKSVRPEYTIEALRIVEQIRTGALGSESKPSGI
jgi:hypothetical protein